MGGAWGVMLACGVGVPTALGQQDLSCDVFQDLEFVGPIVQVFRVPDLVGAEVFFTVQGGDGGAATSDPLIGATRFFVGGEGAQAVIGCRIGFGPGELIPSGRIRFIVGDRGQDASGIGTSVAGAGGGSAVLYLPPGGTTWFNDGVVLAAAGGGGGAKASGALPTNGRGRDGRADECGGDFYANPENPGNGLGGCDGQGGSGTFGGGGGAFSGGEEAIGDGDA